MKRLSLLLAGLLLSGGLADAAEPTPTRLIYEVVSDEAGDEKPITESEMESLIDAVDRRLNPGWFTHVLVRRLDERRIVITFSPDRVEVEWVERLLSMSGTLEFRILADENASGHKEPIELASALDEDKSRVIDEDGNVVGWWVPVREGREKHLSGAGYRGIQKRNRKTADGRAVLEIFVVKGRYNVTGAFLEKATVEVDHATGNPCIGFRFNDIGAQLFGRLTGSHLPDMVTEFTYKLGIILNGQLYSAPSIRSTVYDRGQITGSFSKQEVQDLVDVLNAGTLPAAIRKLEPGAPPKR